jgi:hypothetical protein
MKIAIYDVSSVITNGRPHIGWSVKGLDWRALGAEGGRDGIVVQYTNCP